MTSEMIAEFEAADRLPAPPGARRRTLIGALAVLGIVAVGGVANAVVQHADRVADAAAAACREGQACWNDCTMGDQEPCDLDSTLPDGRYFVVQVSPDGAMAQPDDVQCDDGTTGWYYAQVAVVVRSATGADVPGTRVTEQACVAAAPDQLVDGASGSLPDMFVQAGSHA